ncbi:MAG: hypothetical protein CK425_11170 [Parachlamydia sp.]|nr:MAG: hypothetical protein CK425_11170 [Parachlamydia sp.]
MAKDLANKFLEIEGFKHIYEFGVIVFHLEYKFPLLTVISLRSLLKLHHKMHICYSYDVRLMLGLHHKIDICYSYDVDNCLIFT